MHYLTDISFIGIILCEIIRYICIIEKITKLKHKVMKAEKNFLRIESNNWGLDISNSVDMYIVTEQDRISTKIFVDSEILAGLDVYIFFNGVDGISIPDYMADYMTI